MIIERHEFHVKYGKIKDALVIWKEIVPLWRQMDDAPNVRLLTDITGTAYTLILELEMRDMVQIGFKNFQWGNDPKVADLYQKFVPLCDDSLCTLYKIEI